MDAFSWQEALDLIQPLAFLIAEIVVYAFLVFNYYRFLARRDIFKFDVDRYRNTGDRVITGFVNFFQTIIVYPIILFVWFVILAVVLGFVGKNQSTDTIMLISVALIGAVRVTAYYSEDLSKDLAKMLPFTLLGVFVVDQAYFNFEVSMDLIKSIPDNWHLLVYYFLLIFALELILRIFHIIRRVASKKPAFAPPAVKKDEQNPES